MFLCLSSFCIVCRLLFDFSIWVVNEWCNLCGLIWLVIVCFWFYLVMCFCILWCEIWVLSLDINSVVFVLFVNWLCNLSYLLIYFCVCLVNYILCFLLFLLMMWILFLFRLMFLILIEISLVKCKFVLYISFMIVWLWIESGLLLVIFSNCVILLILRFFGKVCCLCGVEMFFVGLVWSLLCKIRKFRKLCNEDKCVVILLVFIFCFFFCIINWCIYVELSCV